LLRRFGIQLVIFVIAFQLLSFLRETSMLSSNTSLNSIAVSNDAVNLLRVPTLMGEPISL
jgi:hypothetical protein